MVAPTQPIKPLPGTKYGPAIAVTLALTGVAALIKWQLQAESRTMDRMFAQYQSPQSEASRRRVYGAINGTPEDPRKSLFNVLSWGKKSKET